MCDGIAYMVCARGDAHMLLPDDELSSGIASAFDETATPCSIGNVASLTQLKRCLGGLTTRADAWMARVSGSLDRVSLAGREKAVLEHEYGDLICVFCPGAGWRIDYFVVSEKIQEKMLGARIHQQIMGSDHCPVELTLDAR